MYLRRCHQFYVEGVQEKRKRGKAWIEVLGENFKVRHAWKACTLHEAIEGVQDLLWGMIGLMMMMIIIIIHHG